MIPPRRRGCPSPSSAPLVSSPVNGTGNKDAQRYDPHFFLASISVKTFLTPPHVTQPNISHRPGVARRHQMSPGLQAQRQSSCAHNDRISTDHRLVAVACRRYLASVQWFRMISPNAGGPRSRARPLNATLHSHIADDTAQRWWSGTQRRWRGVPVQSPLGP
jgi:hypothetical protein